MRNSGFPIAGYPTSDTLNANVLEDQKEEHASEASKIIRNGEIKMKYPTACGSCQNKDKFCNSCDATSNYKRENVTNETNCYSNPDNMKKEPFKHDSCEGCAFSIVENSPTCAKCQAENFNFVGMKADKVGDTFKPKYYNSGDKDLIAFCLNNNIEFNEGYVMKYVMRHRQKNGKEDLLKAIEVLNRLIDYHYGDTPENKLTEAVCDAKESIEEALEDDVDEMAHKASTKRGW